MNAPEKNITAAATPADALRFLCADAVEQAISAMPSGAPGWPERACSTASAQPG